MLISRHRGPFASDLHRYHGLRLAKIRESGFSVAELGEFAANLPPGSAIARASNPDWAITSTTLLLRELEHGMRVMVWQRTDDGSRKVPQHYPMRLPLTQAEVDAQKKSTSEYDQTTIPKMAEFLGWVGS